MITPYLVPVAGGQPPTNRAASLTSHNIAQGKPVAVAVGGYSGSGLVVTEVAVSSSMLIVGRVFWTVLEVGAFFSKILRAGNELRIQDPAYLRSNRGVTRPGKSRIAPV
jgi:hypothetical protein